jgi:hypothetical protein
LTLTAICCDRKRLQQFVNGDSAQVQVRYRYNIARVGLQRVAQLCLSVLDAQKKALVSGAICSRNALLASARLDVPCARFATAQAFSDEIREFLQDFF